MVETLAEKIEVPRETAARERAIKALERDVRDDRRTSRGRR